MNAIQFWTTPLLQLPGITHGFTHRSGGISTEPYATLNLGLHVGDNRDSVLENRQRVAEIAGFKLESVVCAAQVHGSYVAVVDASHRGVGAFAIETAVPDVDALVTATPDILLMLFFADCLPVYFVDTRQNVVAIAHAGWRGLVGGVMENTLNTMETAFGCSREQILTAVGPGIGPKHFAVGPEVAEHFPPEVIYQREQPYIHLAEAARLRLIANGIPEQNIDVSPECTATNPELYFSHRRDKGRTGRMAGFIGIQQNANR